MKSLKKFKSMILLVITAVIWGLAFVAQEVALSMSAHLLTTECASFWERFHLYP